MVALTNNIGQILFSPNYCGILLERRIRQAVEDAYGVPPTVMECLCDSSSGLQQTPYQLASGLFSVKRMVEGNEYTSGIFHSVVGDRLGGLEERRTSASVIINEPAFSVIYREIAESLSPLIDRSVQLQVLRADTFRE